MANPDADVVNLRIDDVLASHRQQEIAVVVSALQRFEPTKVLVDPKVDRSIAAYRDFRDGGRALRRTDTEQLGFRLAAACGHEQVHPVHVVDEFYEEGIEETILDPAHGAAWQARRATAARELVPTELQDRRHDSCRGGRRRSSRRHLRRRPHPCPGARAFVERAVPPGRSSGVPA